MGFVTQKREISSVGSRSTGPYTVSSYSYASAMKFERLLQSAAKWRKLKILANHSYLRSLNFQRCRLEMHPFLVLSSRSWILLMHYQQKKNVSQEAFGKSQIAISIMEDEFLLS
nr:hypothetical protein Iba_chr10eCG1530 [Ipomoea batatas]